MSARAPLAASGQPLGPAAAPARFFELVADQLAATEDLLREHLASDVPFIDGAGRYLREGGGKRVRPALLLLSAELLGHDGPEVVTYAAMVELIHTATLVHDDVIDHADLRRGRPSLHRLWGNHRTVLLGDWLFTTSMRMALAHGRVEVIRRFCAETLRMTEGELLVLERLGAPDVSVDEYFDIISRKTAGLFAAACSIPGFMPPERPEAAQVLERYGRELGLCFQLIDDLLDYSAREDELGKPVLSDLKEGKLTLPLVLLLPRLAPADRRPVEMVLEDRAFTRVAPEEILERVRAAGTLEEAEAIARRHAEAARSELAYFPPSPVRDALEYAPEFVLTRRS